MLTEQQLDQFIDEFWEDIPNERAEDGPAEDLEEYTLPSDGMIIRQMEKKGKVSRRTWFALILMLLVVPLLLYLSVRFFHGRKYLICSLIVIVAAMLPFFMMFEGRKPKAREIMVISVLAAIGVAGRAAFFMVPSFKPVAAIVILTGVSFGGEAGFLVGCLIMMLSNMFMGQGPWTPWQMFSFGIIGFLAGILYQKGILKARKRDLCIYGFLSVVLIYGGIMNPASILMSYGYITPASLVAFYISGIPVDLVHALSTVIFLWFLSRPLLEKLERIKTVLADKDQIETVIFDEIDVGISGRTAQKVSEKMMLIGRSRQVICITHLAQIAAMADTHFRIEKQVSDGGTRTEIRRLTEAESVEELARILGGAEITDAVFQNASEMKELAGNKKSQTR